MLTKRKNFTLLGIYLGGMFILPLLMIPIIALLHGYSLEQIREGGFLSIEQLALINFISYVALCIMLLFLTRHIFKQDFQKIDSWSGFLKQMGFGLLGTFGAAWLGNSIVMRILGTMEVSANQELAETLLTATPTLMIISIIVLGPIVEEIIFRLVLMNHFNWKPVHHLIFSSLIFGMVHVLVGGWLHIIPYFLMGLVLGYFYLKNNNIWYVTVLHMLHNGLTVVLIFWAQHIMEVY